ncbi:MAG: hypothetical protein KKC68_06650, partial [Candidatus Thermoplasmatota archaeon]|nr:hypothetical protein [Candidatus Thermoplasmatota archaeon]
MPKKNKTDEFPTKLGNYWAHGRSIKWDEVISSSDVRNNIILLQSDYNKIVKSYEPLSKEIRRAYFLFSIFLFGCLGLLMAFESEFVNERMIFASVGVLTFIAIFYSLLISREGRNILNNIKELSKLQKGKIDNKIKEVIKEPKELKEIQCELDKIRKSYSSIDFVLKVSDIEK